MKKYLENFKNYSIVNRKPTFINQLRSSRLCMSFFFICTLVLSMGHSLHAATINVPADFTSIQAAVDSAIAGDTVKVAAGAYFESVVMKESVDIEGAGIEATTIISNIEPFTVTGADNATISGFLLTNTVVRGNGFLSDNTSPTITNCRISDCETNGIECQNGGMPVIKNNIIDNNSGAPNNVGAGIDASGATGLVTIMNNTIFGNSESGIFTGLSTTIKNNLVYSNNGGGIEYRVNGSGNHHIENNTIYGNVTFGIRTRPNSSSITSTVINNIIAFNGTEGFRSNSSSHSIALSFNDVFGNGTNYDGIEPGFGDISEDPLFVDAENGDFHLKAGSPAIDAGNNTITDIDGSRSDMGAFGGPGATETSAVGGPVVSEIVVSPNPVEQGETITIRASASVQ